MQSELVGFKQGAEAQLRGGGCEQVKAWHTFLTSQASSTFLMSEHWDYTDATDVVGGTNALFGAPTFARQIVQRLDNPLRLKWGESETFICHNNRCRPIMLQIAFLPPLSDPN